MLERRVAHAVIGVAALIAASLVSIPAGAATTDSQVPQRAAPTCKGRVATIVGTSGNDDLRGTSGADVVLALGGDDTVRTKGGRDRVCAGGGDDMVISGGGNDIVVGGAGSDIVIAGGGDDYMSGGGGLDGLLGMSGDDAYHGDAGILDLAAFLASTSGVRADLANGTADGEGHDTLDGIEALTGSSSADRLLGDSGLNALFSGEGADVLDGRDGEDYVLLTSAPGPVEIDLGDDVYTGGGLARRIEHVIGSPFDDTIYGDSKFNYLDGADGTDAVDGIDGSDICHAETVINCRDLTATADPPVEPSTDPQGALVGPVGALGKLRRAASAAGQVPPSSPDLTTPHPTSTARQTSTDFGFVNCPMMSSDAQIGTFFTGSMGFFASRSSQGFGGWFPWQYSPYTYSDGTYFWQYVNNAWRGPYHIFNSGGFEWTQGIGVQLTAEAYWWSHPNQQYYYLGSCMGNGFHLGLGF